MAKQKISKNKQVGSRTLEQISRVMALTMAVSPLVAVGPVGVSATNIPIDITMSWSLASDNSYIDISVSTGVYGNTAHDQRITAVNLGKLFYRTDYGTATWLNYGSITKIDGVSALDGGETSFRVYLNFTGILNGQETLEINPSLESPMYDSNGAPINSASTTGVITLNSKDRDAPNFTEFPFTSIMSSGFNLNVQVNEPATVYYVVLPASSNAPTQSDVLGGFQGAFLLLSDTLNTPTTHAITGLDPNTDYKVYLVAEDFSTNGRHDSSVFTLENVRTSGNGVVIDTPPPTEPPPTEPPVQASPSLTADSTYIYDNLPITLTFPSDPDWVNAITSITVNVDNIVSNTNYEKSDGQIRFRHGVLPVGTNTINISANGYSDTAVTQEIQHYNDDGLAPGIQTATANAGNSKIYLHYDKELYVEDGLNTADFSVFINGVSASIFDVSFDNTSQNVELSTTEILKGDTITVNSAAGAVRTLAAGSAEVNAIPVTILAIEAISSSAGRLVNMEGIVVAVHANLTVSQLLQALTVSTGATAAVVDGNAVVSDLSIKVSSSMQVRVTAEDGVLTNYYLLALLAPQISNISLLGGPSVSNNKTKVTVNNPTPDHRYYAAVSPTVQTTIPFDQSGYFSYAYGYPYDITNSSTEISAALTDHISIIEVDTSGEQTTIVGFQDLVVSSSDMGTIDTVSPILDAWPWNDNAIINVDRIVLTYNEALDPLSLPDKSAFAVSKNEGEPQDIDSISFDALFPNQIYIHLHLPVAKVDSVTLNYTVPSTNPITDLSGNPANSFTDQALNNKTPNHFSGTPTFVSLDHLAGEHLPAGTKIVSFQPTGSGNHIHLEFPHDLNKSENKTFFSENFNVKDLLLTYTSGDSHIAVPISGATFSINDGSNLSNPSIDFDIPDWLSPGNLYDLSLTNDPETYTGDEITMPLATDSAEALIALTYTSGVTYNIDAYKFTSVITPASIVADSATANLSGNEILIHFSSEVDPNNLALNNFGLSPSRIIVSSVTNDHSDAHNVILHLQGSLMKDEAVHLFLNEGAVRDYYNNSLTLTSDLLVETSGITEFAPASGPTNLTFVDQDPRNGYISGEAAALRAGDESTIAFYFLVWANAEGQILENDPIAYLQPNGSDLIFQIPNDTHIPEGAAQLAAISTNGNGPNLSPAFSTLSDKKYAADLQLHSEDPQGFANDYKTKIIIDESVTDAYHFVYKNKGISPGNIIPPAQGEILNENEGYANLSGDGIVSAQAGDHILVAEVDNVTDAVYKFGITIAEVKLTAPVLEGVSFEDIVGYANNNKTQIHLPAAGEGHSFKYMSLDVNHPIMTPNVGDDTVHSGKWQPITNNDVIDASNAQPIGIAEVDSNGLIIMYSVGSANVINEMQPTLQFDHNLVIVSEAAGKVTLTVKRTGSSVGTVSVDYSVSEGSTATSNDYVLPNGTLTFEDGESSKTIDITIVNNYQVELDKILLISLSNPTGGSMIGSLNTTFLSIVNDDVEAPTLNVQTEDAVGANSDGKTKLRLMDSAGNNNKFMFKNIQDNNLPWPALGELLNLSGYADAADGTLIDATANDKIVVAEVNNVTGAVYRFNITHADVRLTAPEFTGLSFSDAADFVNNSHTTIHLPSVEGHSFKYTYLDQDFTKPAPNVGDPTSNEGWISIADLKMIQAQNGQFIGVAEVDSNTGLVINYSVGQAVVINDTAEITPPTATTPTIKGNPAVGQQLTANYGYSDVNDDPELNSVYQWYRASSAAVDTIKTPISGATSKSYLLTDEDLGQYLFFSVQPVAATGTSLVGVTMTSAAAYGPIMGRVAPIFTPDTTDTYLESPIELNYEANAAWVAANPVIFNGGSQLSTDQYSISANKIIINPGVLTKGKHTISIRAAGYQDVELDQYVTEASETFAINFDSTVHLDRTHGGIIATAHIDVNAGHEGNESIVFQLMKGNTPIGIIALHADIQDSSTFTARFDTINDPSNADYQVEVFIVNHFTNNITNVGQSLAIPVTMI